METQIGALILATDISRQNEYLSLFRSHLDRGDLRLEDARHRHLVLQVNSGLQRLYFLPKSCGCYNENEVFQCMFFQRD